MSLRYRPKREYSRNLQHCRHEKKIAPIAISANLQKAFAFEVVEFEGTYVELEQQVHHRATLSSFLLA
jgi:hypothetical protein